MQYKCHITILVHLRFLDGAGDAAAWNSIVSILMVMYPKNVSGVMACTEMVFGLGLAIGNAIYQVTSSIYKQLLPY